MTKVKDYILSKEILESEEQQDSSVVHLNRPKNTYALEVVLENETDLILKRKTKTTEKELVLLFGQEQFYIKDCKKGTITILKNCMDIEKELRAFFNRTYFDSTCLKKVQYPEYVDYKGIYDLITNQQYVIAIKNNLFKKCREESITRASIIRYLNKSSELYDKKFFLDVIDTFIYVNDSDTFEQAYALKEILGNNIYYEFTRQIREEHIPFRIDYGSWHLFRKYKDEIISYNLDKKKLVNYMLYDLRAQGLNEPNEYLSTYIDYLRMTKKFKGRSDKYPRYLKSEHDILVTKINNLRRLEQDSIIESLVEENSKFIYEGKNLSILIPQNALDIINEGADLHHCVASYVDKVINGQCVILFMRSNDNLDKSLVTIEYDIQNNMIVQARGLCNRNLTKKEYDFLKKYCKDKDIGLSEYIKYSKTDNDLRQGA